MPKAIFLATTNQKHHVNIIAIQNTGVDIPKFQFLVCCSQLCVLLG